MDISKDTLKAMIQSFDGFELTDEELEQVRPELDNYMTAVEKLQELDLSSQMSSRLLRAQEGGES